MMKEVTYKIPDESAELVTELVTRLGGSMENKKKSGKKPASKKPITPTKQKKIKGRVSLLDFFGKFPDLDLNPVTYRDKLWKRTG
jgi:hypothetical protein